MNALDEPATFAGDVVFGRFESTSLSNRTKAEFVERYNEVTRTDTICADDLVGLLFTGENTDEDRRVDIGAVAYVVTQMLSGAGDDYDDLRAGLAEIGSLADELPL